MGYRRRSDYVEFIFEFIRASKIRLILANRETAVHHVDEDHGMHDLITEWE